MLLNLRSLEEAATGGAVSGALEAALAAVALSSAANVGASGSLAKTLGEVTVSGAGETGALTLPWRAGRAPSRSAGRLLSSYSIAA